MLIKINKRWELDQLAQMCLKYQYQWGLHPQVEASWILIRTQGHLWNVDSLLSSYEAYLRTCFLNNITLSVLSFGVLFLPQIVTWGTEVKLLYNIGWENYHSLCSTTKKYHQNKIKSLNYCLNRKVIKTGNCLSSKVLLTSFYIFCR